MVSQAEIVRTPVFSEQDHQTWAKLHERQYQIVGTTACRLFIKGFPKLQLDPRRLPNPAEMSDRLYSMTGWTLGDAEDEYLDAMGWFDHLYHCRFPVTNYIRRPEDLDFTPLPDLFHEYFGHLGFFTDQRFADDAQMFGQLYLTARNDRQRTDIAHLWWFTAEFGMIRENGKLKIYGAGLLSSPGELAHALKPETPRYNFDVRKAAAMPSAADGFHPAYWVMDGYDHMRRIIFEYADLEGLPRPKPLH